MSDVITRQVAEFLKRQQLEHLEHLDSFRGLELAGETTSSRATPC